MYLKALEMQGFKSFPDKTVLRFDKGMTAVVGPNGSGKSNISDAVLWVLGEQSVKSLRSSKMEDVIFSGTATRRPMGFAEVTLLLDNHDRKAHFDADEIAVTRRYYRSGESEYQLNGKTARLKDIHELFMDTGLGRDGYSMVGQGRIESIVSAKSTDRREIFEEAAGISHYRYRRADALKRLEQAEDNLLRLRDIASELENRLGPLEKQSEKAQQFLALAAERKDVQIGVWLYRYDQSAEMLRRQAEKTDIAKNQYDETLQQAEALFARSREGEERARAITVEIESIRRAAADSEQKARDAENEAKLFSERIKHNEEVLSRIARETGDEENTDRALRENQQKAKAELDVLENEISEIEKNIEQTDGKRRQILEQIRLLQSQLLESGSRASALEKQLAEHRIASTSAASAIREINTRLAALRDQEEEKRAQAAEAEKQESECRRKLEETQKALADQENAAKGSEMKISLRKEKADQLQRQLQEQSAQLALLRSRKKMLEETERNMDGYQGSVKAVVREAAAGRLSGIVGPVSRLLRVESRYAQAIETALGAAAQNIVTETDHDAKDAMTFLKNTNSGRATFLPLSAMKPRLLEENGLDRCQGYVSVASKIVSFDSRYRSVVDYLLARTVIVDTLDHAVPMARKYSHRFKIVTLDGQVINAGGSMTGGSGVRTSGFITRRGEIEKLSDREAQMSEENERLKAQAAAKTEEYERARAQLEGLHAESYRIREEIVRLQSALQVAQSAKESAKQSLSAFEKERTDAAERLANFDSDTDRVASSIARLEGDAQTLAAETAQLENSRTELQKQEEQQTAVLEEMRVSLAQKRTEKQAKTETVQSYERRKEGHREKMSALLAEKKQLLVENEQWSSQKEQKEAQAQQIRSEAEQYASQIRQKVADREQEEAGVTKLREEERQKNSEKEKLAAELVRLEEKTNAMQRDREDTEAKLYEEYNLTIHEAKALGIEIAGITEAESRLAELKRKIKALGQVNVGAVEEFREVSERYSFLSSQMEDVQRSKEELLKLIQDLTDQMSRRFRQRFAEIQRAFSDTFAELFGGGKGELIADDEQNILECGIEIKAQPPGKNVKSISLLSGGEKGLCAIALLFAILKVNPAPFCIFDEVEAALDDVNVARFAEYVRTMTDSTQFILITHRRGSMEAADVMYGVTMQEHGVSKLLELHTAEMVKQLGLES